MSRTPPQTLPDIRKIAVVRANGLGDLMFVLPALDALRQAYPHAEIVYIGKPMHKALFEGRPGPVDRVVVAPISRGVRDEPGATEDPAEVESFLAQMRQEHFDLALQLHGGGRHSNPFTLKLGARYTAGTRTPDAVELDFSIPYLYYQREVLRWLEVVALVGAKTDKIEPQVTVLESDLAEARSVLADGTQPFAVLHPGACDRRRQWPTDRYAAVGDFLVEQGLPLYITGTTAEKPLVDAVVDKMVYQAHDLCGALSMGALTGLLRLSSLLVTNDTGPVHLAAAVGSSTVSIYWGPNIVNAGPIRQRDHRPQLSWTLFCPLCGTDMMRDDAEEAECSHDTSFVVDVSVADVIGGVRDLLAQNGVRNPAEQRADQADERHSTPRQSSNGSGRVPVR